MSASAVDFILIVVSLPSCIVSKSHFVMPRLCRKHWVLQKSVQEVGCRRAGLVFEPQGPLVESVLTVNISFFSIFKKNKKVAN